MTVHSFPLPPSANRYWRHYRGRVVTSDEARRYKLSLAMLAKVDGVRPLSGPVAVTLRVFRARKSGDLDNFAKVTLDAMTGTFYQNDAQVTELHMWLDDDRDRPRVEVTVTSCRDRQE